MASRFLQALGERVRTLRTEAGRRQEELAADAGLDRAYLGRVERGAQNLSAITIARIARALGREPHELLLGLPSYNPETDDQASEAAKDAQRSK